LLLVLNEVRVGFAAGRMTGSAVTRDLEGLADVWNDYERLSRGSYLRIGLISLERALRGRAQELAEQVIANYRSSVPSVRERQWRTARANLQMALTLAPTDARLKAMLRYCEGHLHRIDGEAAKRRRETASASRHFTEAVQAFREAAELHPRWPDPFLGLARTFIYGIEDIDRAADALAQAQRHGYTVGDRETAQLADGYRARGENLAQTARQLRELPQEPEYLRRALASHREALSLYERIPAYPGVARNLRWLRSAIERIELRLGEIDPAAHIG
jgi:tetratricopeptide (TPR) repeat protein